MSGLPDGTRSGVSTSAKVKGSPQGVVPAWNSSRHAEGFQLHGDVRAERQGLLLADAGGDLGVGVKGAGGTTEIIMGCHNVSFLYGWVIHWLEMGWP